MFVPSRETRNQKRGRLVQLDIEVKKKKPNAAPVPVQEIRRDETGHRSTITEISGRFKKKKLCWYS